MSQLQTQSKSKVHNVSLTSSELKTIHTILEDQSRKIFKLDRKKLDDFNRNAINHMELNINSIMRKISLLV